MNKILFSLFICLISLTCYAQRSTQKYEQRADKFYKYYNYEKARKDYIRVWRKDKDNADLLRKIIDCYLSDNTLREEALPYVEHLIKIKPKDYEAQLNKAIALFHAHQFSEAQELVTKLEPFINGNADLLKKATTLKQNIKNAEQYIEKPLDVEFINLGKDINTSRNEVSPYVTFKENTLFYASDKRYNSYAGIYYYNICVSEKEKLDFEKGKTIGSQINSIYDEMVAGISLDGSSLFAFHNRDGSEAMGYATYKGNYRFDPIVDFGPPLDAKGSEYGVWMTEQKDTILFSSENVRGNTDLYYAIKLPTGEWGNARLLPGSINSSEFNENFPVLSKDGQRLYFSSDNKQSMGGYDIYYSTWDDNKKEWGQPVNMGYPINDTYNNYNISWVENRFAYVSAIRPEGQGKYDVYKVVFNNTNPYNALVRCEIRLKKDRRIQIPDFSPLITVTDTLDNLIGTYKAKTDSADFVIALTTGYYKIKVEHDTIEPLSYDLFIPDNRFESVADRIRLIVVPKRLEAESK
jgi:tetratricopeptide (TPR) repeat protein